METMFYVVLASQITGVKLSMTTMKLYQDVASGLVTCIRSFSSEIELAFQSIFNIAAFCEAVEFGKKGVIYDQHGHPNDVELRDYEMIRLPEGLTIEARNLGFTYPSASTAALRDVNLSIKAGQTLAVVGFNGGEKSTLVKILLGLHAYTGELYCNGVPAKDIDLAGLHRRTACLFQDFNRYELTLRENVGLGQTSKLRVTSEINRAVVRGGAEGIMETIGIDGMLDPHGRYKTLEAASGEQSQNGLGPGREQFSESTDSMKATANGFTSATDEPVGKDELASPQSTESISTEPSQSADNATACDKNGAVRLPAGHHITTAVADRFGQHTLDFPLECDQSPVKSEQTAMSPTHAHAAHNGVAEKQATGCGERQTGTPDASSPEYTTQEAAAASAKPKQPKRQVAVGLSGGQWQRVALARAFLRSEEADLVVFDEPSASLDPRAEAALFQRIHSLTSTGSNKATTVYISHRFSTVRKADQIAVVEHGLILELGSHAELMARNGRYAELFNLQKEAYEDGLSVEGRRASCKHGVA